VTPIFILSLPRAGSTLLQRIIGSHELVATTTEPWFLLPFFYSVRQGGVHAIYGHADAAEMVQRFAEESVPGGIDGYFASLRDMALELYSTAAHGKPFFLDKTPRYHVIADDLVRVFASAKFVVLWRHPLSTAASMMETWNEGRWNLDAYSADLFNGQAALLDVYTRNTDRMAALRYEELVQRPADTVRRLLDDLGLPQDPSLVTRFTEIQPFDLDEWDPDGTRRYTSIDPEPLTKWHRTMANPIRKSWCRHYVRWLGEERLATMGYDLNEIIDEIESIPATRHLVLDDLKRAGRGFAYRRARTRVIHTPFPLWRDKRGDLASLEHIGESNRSKGNG
jgi:sulfotransferase family protein